MDQNPPSILGQTQPVSAPPPTEPGPPPDYIQQGFTAKEEKVQASESTSQKDAPPAPPPTKPRFEKKKIIASVLGVLLLVGGIATGVFLIGQRQEIREKAGGSGWPACVPEDIRGGRDGVENCCARLGAGASIYDCDWPQRGWCKPDQCDAARPDPDAPCRTNPDGSNDCNTKRGHCGLFYYDTPSCSAAAPTSPPGQCQNPYKPGNGGPQGQITGVTPNFNWTWCDPSKINWLNLYLWTCNPGSAGCNDAYAIAGVSGSGKNSAAFSDFVLLNNRSAPLAPLSAKTQYWWNLNPNSCASYPSANCPVGGGPDTWTFTTGSAQTSTPTPTSTPDVSGSCLAIKIFDTNWNQITGSQLSALSPGDKIRVTVAGSATSGAFDKARFKINGIVRPEVTGKRPGTEEFFDEYTLPTATTNFTINAEVHHSTLGWF